MAAREDLRARLNKWRGTASSAGRQGLNAPAVRLLCQVGIHLLLGAVLPGAVVLGSAAPFGVAFTAASGTGLCGAGALAGACFGYLTLLPFSDALRYVSASILTFALAFAFYDVRLLRLPWAMPAAAGLLNAATGFVCLSWVSWPPRELFLLLTESAMTAGAAFCFHQVLFPPRRRGEDGELAGRRRFSVLVLACCTLSALSGLSLFQEVSLGRILAAVCALAGAWKGGSAAGAVMGLTLGLSMDLSSGAPPLYAMAWGTAALAAGACRGRPRAAAAGSFTAICALAALWTWDGVLRTSSLYEALFASAVFLALPGRVWQELLPLLSPPQAVPAGQWGQGYVQQRLQATAGAFRSLYESLRGSFRAPANENDIAVVFDRAACKVCRKCSLRAGCWERDYAGTFNALNDATAAMLDRGKGEPGDFPRHFTDRCLHFPAFLNAVNQELTAMLCRRQYSSRLRDSRMAVCRQYGQLSSLLDRAAAELGEELIPDLSKARKLEQYLAGLELHPEIQVFRDGYGRLHAHLRGEDWRAVARTERIPELERVLGVPLRATAGEEELVLVQLEPLMAVAGVAARKKDGETVCGDAGTYFKREDGVLYVLLCDGMGSGELANRESTLTVRLLEQFLQAGVDTEHALITLSSALALRGEESGGFSTVDLLEVDLFTGEGSIYKLGAAPTYVRHNGGVRRFTGSTLPAGLAGPESGRPDRVRLRLEPGDCVLMVSDGISGAGEDGWVCRRLLEFQGDSPKELARSLITDSPEGATDDRTALVIRLAKRT